MAGDAKKLQPIIIKRIKKGGHAAHGGAWKIAYADFVTAMMAFFLLMWLLNATTSDQTQGIADYFNNVPNAIHTTGGGDGPFGGSSAVTAQNTLFGQGSPTMNKKMAQNIVKKQEEKAFKKVEDQLRMAIKDIPELKGLADSLIIDQTPEGLRIQIVDQDKREMFPIGSAQMYDYTEQLLAFVSKAIVQLPNKIAVTGHTDAAKYRRTDFGNWELSTERANAARRVLEKNAITEERLYRVVGKAATEHLVQDNPLAPQNRRISIVLIRDSLIDQEKTLSESSAHTEGQ
jgi:chemotaxis protein MotB